MINTFLDASIRPALLLFLFIWAGLAWANDAHYKVTTFAEGLEHPWSMVFLPNGELLVSERPGRLRRISPEGAVSAPISNLPSIFAKGQGGLLGLAVDPDFQSNGHIYFSYSESDGDLAGTAVARAKLIENELHDLQVIFRQLPKVGGDKHFGSRLLFASDGTLFVTLGERFYHMAEAQALNNHLGKIVRITADGRVPRDNPYANAKGALPEIWSYGHRNIQGAALHPQTGELWIHEHGPRGGDEINLPMPGKNYGWPKASYGSHYWLIPIKDDHRGQGYEEPIYQWTPSIAPSGMAFYAGDKFPEWRGNLFIGALAGRHLVRLDLSGLNLISEERLLEGLEQRIRDVAEGPDGFLYLLTDDLKGKILRLEPTQ